MISHFLLGEELFIVKVSEAVFDPVFNEKILGLVIPFWPGHGPLVLYLFGALSAKSLAQKGFSMLHEMRLHQRLGYFLKRPNHPGLKSQHQDNSRVSPNPLWWYSSIMLSGARFPRRHKDWNYALGTNGQLVSNKYS